MSDPVLSIVIPTIPGREHWLEIAERQFRELTTVPHEIIVLRGFNACGPAWQAGGEQAKGDYMYFAADDQEPMEGWDVAAIEACDRGVLPAPRIYNTDGSVQSCGGSWGELEPDGSKTEFTRAPFVSRAQWDLIQPMLPAHYYTDNWFTHRAGLHGIPTVVTYGYQIIHHMTHEGRNEGRMGHDMWVYAMACTGRDVWADES